MTRLLYLVANDWYFCNHRLPLAVAAREAGYEVAVATRVDQHEDEIRSAGLTLIPIGLSRTGQNPLRDLVSLRELVGIYRRVRPDIVHHVALKPVLYGTLAARLTGVPGVVNALAGLGYVFSSSDLRARVLRPLVGVANHLLLDGARQRLIVQNPDDQRLFTEGGMVASSRIRLIRGSGVDLKRFNVVAEPEGPPLVLLPARLLRDKGVEEFVDAARRLKRDGVAARFALVGDPDPENPAAIRQDTLQAWQNEGVIEWWGWRDDMAAVYPQCNVVCLPSYREGLPKALIEAAACGRAIVTSDVPGCREVVKNGDNGLLVPPKDSAALAAALLRLIADPQLRARMGERGRLRAVNEFSIDRVIEQTLSIYRELTPP